VNEKREFREKKLKKWIEKYGDPYESSFSITNSPGEIKDNFESLENQSVSSGGRVLAFRKQGKLAFLDIGDITGRIQLFMRKNDLENFDDAELLDLGDIIFVQGKVMKTKVGEVSIFVSKFSLVSKGRHELPDKMHGISDPETRQRKRWVDMAIGGDIAKDVVFISRFFQKAREYWQSEGFLEVFTPMLHQIPGGAYARPFETHHNALDLSLYLRIAPELYLKKLLVGGCPKVFEIGRNFRNEGISKKHNPEFFGLEAYEAWGSFETMMSRSEEFIKFLAADLLKNDSFEWMGKKISLKGKFKRLDFRQALIDAVGIDIDSMSKLEDYKDVFKKHNLNWGNGMTVGRAQDKLYGEYIESKIVNPTFVTGYPKEMSPLAKSIPGSKNWTQRFELVIAGCEVANAFGELHDPDEQSRRMKNQQDAKDSGDLEAQPIDDSYIEALEFGMPSAGGIGFGVERLLMMFLNKDSIRDVILFPMLKPKRDE
tara:strand:- start:71140 stop:72591 length:1452 start_codon:yes stop_codon:yes gene_type:complete